MAAAIPVPPEGFAPQDDRATLPVKHRMTLMWAIMFVSICQFLDLTIANVALPHMRTSLGASFDTISWVLTSFIMAGAIVTPITGWLSDRIGSRRLFLIATATFLGSSALCGAAHSLTEMVVFRALQGAASALMGPLSQTVMFDINPPSKQPGAITLWGTVSMVAPISGPFLGGFLTEYLNWRWVYYVNLPLGIPALIIMWMLLPSRPLSLRPLDRFGFGTIALGLGSLQLLLDRGQSQDWLNSWEIIIELVVAISCLWMFVVQTTSSKKPLFNPALYKNTNFLIGMVFMIMMGLTNIALSATLPTMYQTVYGYSVITTGMLMAPRGIGLTVTMWMTNYLAKRVDFRWLVGVGFSILAYAMWTMSQWALEMGRDYIVYSGLLQGAGLGMIFTPINLVAFRSLSPELRTDGAAVLSLARSLGGSFGISYIVTMIARVGQTSHADIAASVTGGTTPIVDLSTLVGLGGDTGAAVLAMINGEVDRQAAMIAYLDNFHLFTIVLLAFIPMTLLLRKAPPSVFTEMPVEH
ncbi:MAG: multidrug efflux MFS transporter [Novosphingobium sp.]|nr:multidrug efflux MFS transporter [Novosphingobium sp.]